MKLFIPELGTKIKLTKNWNFSLYTERRNLILGKEKGLVTEVNRPYDVRSSSGIRVVDRKVSLWNGFDEQYQFFGDARVPTSSETAISRDSNFWRFWKSPLGCVSCTIPRNTVLEIDRIYIRKGNEDFSSVTFKFAEKRKIRFWAKLAEVNTMSFTLVG